MTRHSEYERAPLKGDAEPNTSQALPSTAWTTADGHAARATRERPRIPPTPTDPDVLWTWEADDLNGRGARGVTDAAGKAYLALLTALRSMPAGSQGVIRPAWLNIHAYPYPCYAYGPIWLRTHRDSRTSHIVTQDNQ